MDKYPSYRNVDDQEPVPIPGPPDNEPVPIPGPSPPIPKPRQVPWFWIAVIAVVVAIIALMVYNRDKLPRKFF